MTAFARTVISGSTQPGRRDKFLSRGGMASDGLASDGEATRPRRRSAPSGPCHPAVHPALTFPCLWFASGRGPPDAASNASDEASGLILDASSATSEGRRSGRQGARDAHPRTRPEMAPTPSPSRQGRRAAHGARPTIADAKGPRIPQSRRDLAALERFAGLY
jgi:hypothetical protein